MLQKLKYTLIILYSKACNKSCVDFFGGTYLVAGNYVKRIK